ncbi:putative hydroxymethylpyrimidine transporter CytX [Sporomusaceae bacterium BoRhaA]|uniref:putative hydroxymethylpyrimidine transporter CytX n=1 Tax=Pelorhabdus rhamnosifermentans TaxID=2772457 RepID=UPI001C0627C0|nr:putative hydroxymethylpyrimidine transporter CytX [Pelorhabdus rhamnosifermentans]MBU2703294.1 putative hydroxymethylpyrimidine transporter CytX [Pelorhabdus rhamnosifermentans]
MNIGNANNLTLPHFTFLWFGAAVSVAEIITGGLIAPLGFVKGVLAILLGHLVGTTLLALSGMIGTESRMPAIMSTRISFGLYGSYLFSLLNVLQLIGWTAVMIVSGARSVNQITSTLYQFDHLALWMGILGAIIFVWILFGKEGWKKLNMIAVFLLFLLTVILSYVIFRQPGLLSGVGSGTLSFGEAVELSVIMPLSWLPLIADYTRYARSKSDGAIGSWLGYFVGSSWMYITGLGAAIVAGNVDPAAMMIAAQLGVFALGIIVLATVTTTFMDAYSAGVTFLNIFPSFDEKFAAVIMTIVGTVTAIFIDMEQYESFLYAVGSVFSPLFAILLMDYFVLGETQLHSKLLLNWEAFIVWGVGVWLYYQFVMLDLVMGATIPVLFVTAIFHLVAKRLLNSWSGIKKYRNI